MYQATVEINGQTFYECDLDGPLPQYDLMRITIQERIKPLETLSKSDPGREVLFHRDKQGKLALPVVDSQSPLAKPKIITFSYDRVQNPEGPGFLYNVGHATIAPQDAMMWANLNTRPKLIEDD